MYRLVRVATAYGVQIAEDTVGDERRERCGEHRNGFQTGVERLVGCQFVACQTAAPEPLAVEAHRNFRLLSRKTVHIGVEGEERVGIVERAEELAAHFVHAVPVELEVVPGLRVGDHVPTRRVGAVGRKYFEGIHGIT